MTASPFIIGRESAANIYFGDAYAFGGRDYSSRALGEVMREAVALVECMNLTAAANSEPPRCVGDDALHEPPNPPYFDPDDELVTAVINWGAINISQAAADAAQVAKQMIVAAGVKAARTKQASSGIAPRRGAPTSARIGPRRRNAAPPANRRNSFSSTSSSSSAGSSPGGSGGNTPSREPPSPSSDLPLEVIEFCSWLAQEVVNAIVAQRARDGLATATENAQRWYANLIHYLTEVDDTLPTAGRNPGMALVPFGNGAWTLCCSYWVPFGIWLVRWIQWCVGTGLYQLLSFRACRRPSRTSLATTTTIVPPSFTGCTFRP